MSWLSEFKSAIVSADVDKIDSLTNRFPERMTKEEIGETAALLKSAIELVGEKQAKLKIELEKIQKARAYAQ